MDTIFLQRPQAEKAATSAAGICIAICLIFTQNLWISARDIGSLTGISPTLNYVKESQKIQEQLFEQDIAEKYKNFEIKEIDKGVKHIKMVKYFNRQPVRINIIEISRNVNDSLIIEPAIASATLSSRTKISNIASRDNAFIAINGGYFKPQTGTPLGTLMINKNVYTGPIYDRVALGIFDNGFDMARVKLKAEIITNIGKLKIDNINQPRMLSTHTIVYTPMWGEYSPPTPQYGKQIVIENNRLIEISSKPCKIPKNGYVISGSAKNLDTIIKAGIFKLDIKTNPEWKNVNHIVSGGPYLVKQSEIFVDTAEQKLTAIGGRNPRTAIGYTKDNNLIMLTADGREGNSIGLTLYELAKLMKDFGCVNAMNLDGGGSTIMYINGKVVNKPAVQGGIPLSHTLLVKKLS